MKKTKAAVSSTVGRHVGCSHPRAAGLCAGVALCPDCKRVWVLHGNDTVKAYRAGGSTPNAGGHRQVPAKGDHE